MAKSVELNRPDVQAAVTEAFVAYDNALLAGDVEILNEYFLGDALATRFGLGQELYGADEITAWRRTAAPLVRPPLRRYDVVSIDDNTAVVTAEWEEADVIGRQSQTWVRTAAGWRILSGHVSTRAAVSA